MKLDCIAFVNQNNETLLTHAASTECAHIALALHELLKQHREPVFALRSYVDGSGQEVCAELLTYSALERAPGEALARIELWYPLLPDFMANHQPDAQLDKAQYQLAGVLLVADTKNALEAGYYHSQNLEHGWNPRVPTRSSSVGDVFVITSARREKPEAFAVAGIGFVPVQLV